MQPFEKNFHALDDVTATGASESFDNTKFGAGATICVEHTDSPNATVKMQYSFDNSTWHDFSDVSATSTSSGSDKVDTFTPSGKYPYLRVNITSYSAGTINAYIYNNSY